MNSIDYYKQQSQFSNPGIYAAYFNELPDQPEKICEILQGILLHFLDVDAKKQASIRLTDMDLRYCEKMLEKILSMSNASLLHPREIDQKLVSSCRDFSLLFCAILRHKHIPARLRFGFFAFQFPGFHHDQVLVEYWHAEKQTWCLADPRVNAIFREKSQLLQNHRAHDVARHAFFTAGEAWLYCRNGAKQADKFGTSIAREIRGWWYIRNKVIQDFAALNKMELLLWDCWGMMLQDASDAFLAEEKQIELLDKIAKLGSQMEIDVEKITQVYAIKKELRVGKQIYCDSIGGKKGVVELSGGQSAT